MRPHSPNRIGVTMRRRLVGAPVSVAIDHAALIKRVHVISIIIRIVSIVSSDVSITIYNDTVRCVIARPSLLHYCVFDSTSVS